MVIYNWSVGLHKDNIQVSPSSQEGHKIVDRSFLSKDRDCWDGYGHNYNQLRGGIVKVVLAIGLECL